ncbi:hypothetical protein H097_06597 [Pseudomonas sp. FH4]|uniref:DUF1654 domain-containing protein n=1 Tax=Pseudomonas brenneri TaxID=129817 RepID=UPI0003DC8021|nr:hypothetical protein H097_06597 [Pseudomonas sp. FH4]MBF8005495.1 DUF1654 domain-containing protein [Pseudomonas brenneri]
MFQSACIPQRPPSPYELLSYRIHRQVNSPAAQYRRRTVITRQSGELEADWDCLLEQLVVEDSVRVLPLEDGGVQLSWTNQHPS